MHFELLLDQLHRQEGWVGMQQKPEPVLSGSFFSITGSGGIIDAYRYEAPKK